MIDREVQKKYRKKMAITFTILSVVAVASIVIMVFLIRAMI